MKNFTLVEKYKRKTAWGKETIHVWRHNDTGVTLNFKQSVMWHRGHAHHHATWTIPGRGTGTLQFWLRHITKLARQVHG
jgi:hypothetical protein